MIRFSMPLYWIFFVIISSYAPQALQLYWLTNLLTNMFYSVIMRKIDKRKMKEEEEKITNTNQDFIFNPSTFEVTKIEKININKKIE
jgi:membrane protein insertase Oxa1/YidC/SpoIIIJ